MNGTVLEVRWHGRGGQGAKTAAVLFADVAVAAGKYVQAFPEYGPERSGAPVIAYNRISEKPIGIHTPVISPDLVLILDPNFLGRKDMVRGLPAQGLLVVNTPRAVDELRDVYGKDLDDVRVWTIDASALAVETIGREIPNTPMVAAAVRLTKLATLEDLKEILARKLEKKFRGRPELVQGNLEAITRGFREVEGA